MVRTFKNSNENKEEIKEFNKQEITKHLLQKAM